MAMTDRQVKMLLMQKFTQLLKNPYLQGLWVAEFGNENIKTESGRQKIVEFLPWFVFDGNPEKGDIKNPKSVEGIEKSLKSMVLRVISDKFYGGFEAAYLELRKARVEPITDYSVKEAASDEECRQFVALLLICRTLVRRKGRVLS